MFIILNDGRITRGRRGRVMIGRAQDADLRIDGAAIQPHQCEIIANQSGDWHIRNLAGKPILVNGRTLTEGNSINVVQPCQLTIAQYKLELRESSVAGAISQRLRHKLFALETELHNAVLDHIRTSGQSTDAK